MPAGISGVRLGNETFDAVPESSRIRCLRDQIVLKPLEWRPSAVIDVAYFGKPLRGEVLSVGPGTYPKRYNGRKGQRSKTWDSKAFRPTEVKVGDIVELGGLEIGGYLHTTFRWGATECVMVREEDIAIVCEG
jgi:hypothetical protein